MDIVEDANIDMMDLSVQLSCLSILGEAEVKDEGISDIENRLNDAQHRISQWMQSTSIIWLQSEEMVADFFGAVNEVGLLSQVLSNLSFGEGSKYSMLSERAHTVLKTAMAMLGNEFRQVLTFSRQSFGPVCRMSFCSTEDGIVHYQENGSVRSSFSSNQLNSEVTVWGDSISISPEHNIDLVDLDAIPHLKNITKLMFVLNFKNELSQSYISVTKDALDDCLYILGLEKLTTDEMLKMEWNVLDSKIKKHIRGVKLFVRGYLASEKSLCEKIFNEFGAFKSVCFVEATRISVLQLLNFPRCIANMSPYAPEKLFLLLDLYGVLKDLLPDINALFSDDAICSVPRDFFEVLIKLGECIKETFTGFMDLLASASSSSSWKVPFPRGRVPHLLKYVMNYLRTLTDYSEELGLILEDNSKGETILLSSDVSPARGEEGNTESVFTPPMTLPYRSVCSSLESSLLATSDLYEDSSLKHIYLMNNIHYMLHKIEDSEALRRILWAECLQRKLNYWHHAMMYIRSTWGPVLSLCKLDEDDWDSRRLIMQRIKAFNIAFKKIYETQTAWKVPDLQLRKGLQICISSYVVQAYRTLIGIHCNKISIRHIKFTVDDLESYILDLFEGAPKKLRSP